MSDGIFYERTWIVHFTGDRTLQCDTPDSAARCAIRESSRSFEASQQYLDVFFTRLDPISGATMQLTPEELSTVAGWLAVYTNLKNAIR